MSQVKHGLKRAADFCIKWLLIAFIRVAFRPKISYASEKARELAFSQPRVIVCNHVRGWDGAVIYSLIARQPITALTAKDMMDQSILLRCLLHFLPVLAIDRRNVSLSWLRGSRQLLKGGRHIMIFPEGKCQFDRVTKDMKPGCVLLAATSGTSMLPIYHNGTYHFFIGKRFRMIVGEPIEVTPPPEGTQAAELDRQAEALLDTFHDLERELTGTVRRSPQQEEV